MIADKACYERGCACHDPRDGDGVEVTEKREWVGLTEEEVLEWRKHYKFSRALIAEVEAKLKEKNNAN